MTTPDNSSNSGLQTGQSTYQWNHDCEGAGRLLTVGVAIASPSGVSVASVTCGGLPLSLVAAGEAGNVRGELWQMRDPPIGSHAVEVTFSGSCDSWSVANSFSGYGRFLEAVTTNTGINFSSSIAYNVTPVTDDATVLDFIVIDNGAGLDAGVGQTSLVEIASGPLNLSLGASIRGPVSPPASTAMEWDSLSAGSFVIISCALAPYEAIFTRLSAAGVGMFPYSGFAAKAPAGGPPQAVYTRLSAAGVGMFRYSAFAPKTPASGGGGAVYLPLYPIATMVCNRGMMRG